MRFNLPTRSVVSCHVPVRSVSAWICSTIPLMLFFDGRYPRRAWPVLAEYIRPNVYPRKSNSPSGILQIRVFSSLIVSPSLTVISRNRCKASSALPLLHRITLHLDYRLLGVSPGTVRVLLGWKVGFEDRFQHQHCCRHADPITQGRDAQRPEFAVGLRNVHSSDRSRSVSLLPESKRQFAKPPLHPIRVDIREVLTVHSRCALV